jgi:hypothetical protein
VNRNSEQHYAQVPRAEIRRSRFKRDFNLLTTINEGDLVPIYCDEVLPGDTAKISMNALIRMSTPLYPVMDNCNCDFYFFFVPSRLLWDHFENLMGQNDSSYWAEPVEYTTPKTKAPKGGWNVGTIADYFGIPTGVENIEVNSLPLRAYTKIWNEWFRDQNLSEPRPMSTGDETTEGANANDGGLNSPERGGQVLKVTKYKDYFTSCLPSPQKGEAVTLPLTGNAPIQVYKDKNLTQKAGLDVPGTTTVLVPWGRGATLNGNGNTGTNKYTEALDNPANDGKWKGVGYIGADLKEIQSATINELRQAIAVQHILERDARTGTRYKEILQGAWGVTSPDARLDRSEYIGGYRLPININQVVQTSSTDNTSPQGNTGAYSMTTMSRNMCTYSATEHGFIIGLAAVRVEHSYQQGLARMWTRSTRFSYYDPMLANLGEQAVLNQEIYAQGTAQDEEVFGYQEAWADYRYRTNMVTSEMRSTYAQTLDAWHYADKYSELPKLSGRWITENKTNIDRTLAVQSSNSHQFICNFYFDQTWTRPLPIYSVPGLDTI